MVEMAMASITIFSFLFGIVGFVFKTWIINPLSTAIENLQKTVDALAKTINREQERTTDLKIKFAEIDQRAKSAHNRIDEVGERLLLVENKCNNCSCKDK